MTFNWPHFARKLGDLGAAMCRAEANLHVPNRSRPSPPGNRRKSEAEARRCAPKRPTNLGCREPVAHPSPPLFGESESETTYRKPGSKSSCVGPLRAEGYPCSGLTANPKRPPTEPSRNWPIAAPPSLKSHPETKARSGKYICSTHTDQGTPTLVETGPSSDPSAGSHPGDAFTVSGPPIFGSKPRV